MASTQTRHPWRATIRTVFQALVALAVMWGVLIEAAGLDPDAPVIAASVAVMGAIARIMALPQVNAWLTRFVPLLATGDDTDPHALYHVDPDQRLDHDGGPGSTADDPR